MSRHRRSFHDCLYLQLVEFYSRITSASFIALWSLLIMSKWNYNSGSEYWVGVTNTKTNTLRHQEPRSLWQNVVTGRNSTFLFYLFTSCHFPLFLTFYFLFLPPLFSRPVTLAQWTSESIGLCFFRRNIKFILTCDLLQFCTDDVTATFPIAFLFALKFFITADQWSLL